MSSHSNDYQLQTLEAIRQQLKHHTPRLKFDPQFSPQEHAVWKRNTVENRLYDDIPIPEGVDDATFL